MTSLMILALITRMQDPSLSISQRNDACFELRGVAGAEVVSAMRQALGDQKVRACAATNLFKAGAIEELKDALKDSDFEVRAVAVRELGGFEKPELLPLIAAAAQDPQLLVSINAVEGLSNYRNPVVVPFLLEVAKLGGLVGGAALDRAVQFHDPRVLAVARELLEHPDITDRLTAMRALGAAGDATDLPKLRAIAREETQAVASAGRGFGLIPAISLSRAAQTTVEAIESRR